MTTFSLEQAKIFNVKYPGEKVVREPHFSSELTEENKFLIVTKDGPFYLDNFLLEYRDKDGTVTELEVDKDYDFALRFNAGSFLAGQPIFAGVQVHRPIKDGFIYVSYKKLGGLFSMDADKVLQRIHETIYDPKMGLWENLVDLPHSLIAEAHSLHVKDMKGFNDLIEVVEKGFRELKKDSQPSLWLHKELLEEKAQRVRLEGRVKFLEEKIELILQNLATN